MNVTIRDGAGRLRSPEGALPAREFPLVQHDRSVPASRPLNVTIRGDATRALAGMSESAKIAHTAEMAKNVGQFNRGYESGRKSVDRWAPAFFGFIIGAPLGAAITLAGATVLS